MSDGAIAYARFRLSYASRLPEGMGRPVLFEGISCFRFQGELIAHYSEAFDRGLALVHLAVPAEAHQAHLGEGHGGAKPASRRPSAPRSDFARLRAAFALFRHLVGLGGLASITSAVVQVRRARSPSAAARRPPRG